MAMKFNSSDLPRPDIDYFYQGDDLNMGIGHLDGYVGCLSFAFNNMESLLIGLFGRILNMDSFATQAVWSSMMWRAKIELLNAGFVRRPDLEPLTSYWKRLFALLVELGADRNFVLHGQREQQYDSTGKTGDFVKSNNFTDMWGFSRRHDERIDEAELKEIILDIGAATIALSKLDNHLCGQKPSLDDLLQSAIRRRPARSQRHI